MYPYLCETVTDSGTKQDTLKKYVFPGHPWIKWAVPKIQSLTIHPNLISPLGEIERERETDKKKVDERFHGYWIQRINSGERMNSWHTKSTALIADSLLSFPDSWPRKCSWPFTFWILNELFGADAFPLALISSQFGNLESGKGPIQLIWQVTARAALPGLVIFLCQIIN